MKFLNFLLLLLVTVLFTISCSKEPSNEIIKTKTEKGDWVYNPSLNKPVQVEQTYYLLQPTWGQAFSISFKYGKYLVSFVLGVIFIFLMVMVVYSQYANPSWAPKLFEKWWVTISFVLLAIGASCIYSRPSIVRFENDKWVKKEVYDSVMQADNNTKAIWDQYEKSGTIIGAEIQK